MTSHKLVIQSGGVAASKTSLDSGVMTVHPDIQFHGGYDDSTPLSPTSSFSVSSIGNIEHSFIDALLLCHWDNILGPKLEHVWYVTGRSQPHTNILRFVTNQVLSGEICRDVHCSQVDFKFFDIPDKGVIIPSFIFSAQGSSGISLQAIALIIPNSELTLYLHQVDLIHSWLTRVISKLRVICAKKDFATSGLADLSSWLWSFMDMLSSLQEVGLPQKIELSYTAFSSPHKVDLDFLRQVISSHLMTFGRSVIFGKRVDRVNILVYTLGLFCWDSERLCSRAALSGRNWPYYQDVCIQGCLKNDDDSINMSHRDLLCSRYPTTIIDVDNRSITHSSSAADHPWLSHEALVRELEELYQGQEGYGERPAKMNPAVSMTSESLVRDLLDNVYKLPPDHGKREAYICHFMHTLQRRAFCLIKYLEGDQQSSSTASSRVNVKKLRQDLGLALEGDLRIVLATADKLKPGLYQYVLGDKKYDTEYLPNMTDVL
uniref:Uncharacterized protein n=1 Tax=Arion vulgaris TaxID=1028688 RepID=A0A0B6ZUZ3_9EUPU